MDKRLGTLVIFALLVVAPLGLNLSTTAGAEGNQSNQKLSAANKLRSDGNYKEALDAYQRILELGELPSPDLTKALAGSLECLQRLNRAYQTDEFREKLVKQYSQDWRMLSTIAQTYDEVDQWGYRISGEFRRGNQRGGGKVINADARDRVRALQLFQQAVELLEDEPATKKYPEAATLLLSYAEAMLYNNQYDQSWRLQILTDLSVLPDYDEGWNSFYGGPQGAPVTAEGEPVYFAVPDSWLTARNDGERWRWLLDELVRWQPNRRNQVLMIRAQFLQSQFGVETLRTYGWWFGRQAPQTEKAETGTFALHTLEEEETIARLATGVKRFALPDEHNHIKLRQRIITNAEPSKNQSQLRDSVHGLANTFLNRRQYPRAAEYFQLALEKNLGRLEAKRQLEQITGNWGRFEPVMAQPHGKGASVDFRFRNAKRVEFTAYRVKVPELLSDLKSMLQSHQGKTIPWDKLQIENLGYRLVRQNEKKYLGEQVADWHLDLEPLPNHFDKRITINTPLQQAGAYLLTSKVKGGNTTHIILWINDTAIVKKPLDNKSLYYIADAVTGKPIPKCNVEFFGYWNEHLGDRKYKMHTEQFAKFTDKSGLVELSAEEDQRRFRWLAIATTTDGRFAYLGFRHVWTGKYRDQAYHQLKTFTVTDRPVYRPEQKVHFKFWVRQAQHELKDITLYGAKTFQIEIRDPRNEKVYSKQITSDAFGGLEGSWDIPPGATLGQYRLNVVNHGGGSFRVEEYKKPEFEVTIDAPDKPIALGEKVTAKINAKYYFGAPVTEATVKYKVLRTPYAENWYPPMPWDWLYGPGYWWFGEDYPWYPGWLRWGCFRPTPPWFWHSPTQPEVVAEREMPISADGTVEVEIDTAMAKQFHPDQDHSYQIQAEVIDQSRRAIVGNGRVLVARKPFKIYVWTHRGHYRVGDTIQVGAAARSLDGKPVSGSGSLRLLKIRYEEGKPIESEAGTWNLITSESGQAELQIKASEPGQYRLSYELTDQSGNQIEGGHLLTIAGEGFTGSEFKFNDLELVPDRAEYRPGDKVKLRVNTNRTGAAVLLFLRPSNSTYIKPKLIQLDGKSTEVEVEVTEKDTPNFFIEAVTVHGGRAHTVARELFVPPIKRILSLNVEPSAESYLPDEQAKFTITVTDEQGAPFVGSLALSIYDKAVEYISGGSNVPDIREFFWKWRRNHRPRGENNLERYSSDLVKSNQQQMRNLGLFGDSVVDELDGSASRSGFGNTKRLSKFASGGGGGLGGGVGRPAMAPMAAVEESEAVADSASVDSALVRTQSEPAGEPDAASGAVEPSIRENFADTALWIGNLKTDEQGVAQVELDMPQNLTTWKLRAWGVGHGTRVGEGSTEVVTRKNIIIRLQAPRFFVERDQVVLSAVVHNYLESDKQVRVVLDLAGNRLEGLAEMEKTVTVAAGGETRVDWLVKAVREGEAKITMSALTDEESDAMAMTFPVHVHGMLKTESYTGVIRPSDSMGKFTISVPAERRAEHTRLELRYTPTLAGAMVDALPYLIDYPYGCTEQTLNRFVPAVITQQTLLRMNLDLAEIGEKRTNLNAQEIGDDIERAKGWKRLDSNPVFDDEELKAIVVKGVKKLTSMQLSDGGWGWFSGWGERSSPHTTAVVVHGMLIAQENEVAIVPGVVDRGLSWLESYQTEQVHKLNRFQQGKKRNTKQFADNIDALVHMVLTEGKQIEKENTHQKMTEHLYRSRTHLAPYSLATFGLALHMQDEVEKRDMVIRNLSQFVAQDDENQTAWLELPGGYWWYWYGSENEAMAYYLKLLVATDPDSEVASRLVKYLLNNRKHGTYWKSTRDTALVVEAFADFLAATGEDDPNVQLEVWIDGQQRRSVEISRENLFTFDNKLVLTGDMLASGRHTVELRKQGESPIYFNGYLTNFTLEDDITAAGLELKVNRKYYKLTPVEATTDVAGSQGQVVSQLVEKYERTEIVNHADVVSGDLVEVELEVESKNDYEYILLEDMKAAGFEPVAIRSGYNGNELGAYIELRDDRVSLFVARLARGKHSVSYRLRAEIPGRFSALPTRASAMYAPELKANSDSLKVEIVDKPKE